MMRIFDHLDRALRHLREDRRTRQYQIAEEAGITKAMLSAYETGKQKPSLETLDKLLAALGCDLVDLHQALAIFRSEPSREPPGSGARWRASEPTAASAAASRRPVSDRSSADVYSALGIEQPLEEDEEEALGEVLTSFHKLIRHIHGRLHERGPEADTEDVSGAGASEGGTSEDSGALDEHQPRGRLRSHRR